MGWQELEGPSDLSREKRQAESEKERSRLEAVEDAAKRAFRGAKQKPLVEELERVIRRPSYQPGCSAEQIAYLEGYRRLAIDLLRRGGVYE